MRFVPIGLLAAAFAIAPAGWAAADAFVRPMGKIVLLDSSDARDGAGVPSVAPGSQFAVNCGCLGSRGDIRVVFALSPQGDEKPTGYKKLLVTSERVEKGAVRVTVPTTPYLANHTVEVKVYVVGAAAVHACDAGKVRIT